MKSLLSLLCLLVATVAVAQEPAWVVQGRAFQASGEAYSAAKRAEFRADLRTDAIVRAIDNLGDGYGGRYVPPVYSGGGVPPVFSAPAVPKQKWQRHYHARDRRNEYKSQQIQQQAWELQMRGGK